MYIFFAFLTINFYQSNMFLNYVISTNKSAINLFLALNSCYTGAILWQLEEINLLITVCISTISWSQVSTECGLKYNMEILILIDLFSLTNCSFVETTNCCFFFMFLIDMFYEKFNYFRTLHRPSLIALIVLLILVIL